MPKLKIMMLIFVITLNTMLITACWNYSELEDMAIVAGAAVDRDPNTGEFILTVEVVDPAPPEAKESQVLSTIITTKGYTIFGAVRNAISSSGRKLYWSHAKAIIVAEEIAREDILPVIDWIKRDAEVRSDMWIFISKGQPAMEILKTNTDISRIIAYHLEDTVNAGKAISRYPRVQLREFLEDVISKGASGTVAVVQIKTDEEGHKVPKVQGTAIFKGKKLVGFLDGKETRSMMWVKNELIGGALVEQDVTVKGKTTTTTLEIFRANTKLKPYQDENGQIVIKIDILTDISVAEIDHGLDPADEKVQEAIEKAAKDALKLRIINTIEKAQQHQSDVFEFGEAIQQNMPALWKQIEPNWDEVFPTVETDINIRINIRGTGLSSKGIKEGA